ncbi:3362_t:CDS:1, partial [Dentiscutata heterogama]
VWHPIELVDLGYLEQSGYLGYLGHSRNLEYLGYLGHIAYI